jgi:chromosome segregation ATPase
MHGCSMPRVGSTLTTLPPACCHSQAEAAERARAELRSVRDELSKAAADKAAAAAALDAAAGLASAAEADLQGLRAQLEGAQARHAAAAEEAAMLRANLDEVCHALSATQTSMLKL